MAWSKKKEITVTVEDFIEKDALWHAQFADKDGRECLIQVVPDEDAINPREYPNLFTWSTTKNAGYTDDGALSPDEIEEYRLGKNEESGRCPSKAFARDYLVFPLYLYRHGGDVIDTSPRMFRVFDPQGLDSGHMGYAYLEKKKAREMYDGQRLTKSRVKELYTLLKSEVETMNAWLEGSVYGIIITELESEAGEYVYGFVCPERKDIQNYVQEVLCERLPEAARRELTERLIA